MGRWRNATEEERNHLLRYGRWPKKPALRPAPKRLTRRAPLVPLAPIPASQPKEARITLAEVRRRLTEIKMERGCLDCGYRTHSSALEFDHIRGRKSVLLSRCTLRYWSQVEHELAKCDVVCANCHRIRHATRGYAAD